MSRNRRRLNRKWKEISLEFDAIIDYAVPVARHRRTGSTHGSPVQLLLED